MLRNLKEYASDVFNLITAKTAITPTQKLYRQEKYRAMGTMPKDGYTWNPLRNFPRNQSCFCGSSKKTKKCCGPYLASLVSNGFAEQLRMDMPGLLAGKKTLPCAPRNRVENQ